MATPKIVGVLNLTPDSYFDGGEYINLEDALRRTGEMLAEGADIIDIGGESTGPGSVDVSVEQELERTIPVIEAIRDEYPDAVLSIDTWKSVVAREALSAGVSIVNDVTAGRADAELFGVAAEANAQLVLMYSKDGTPRTTKDPKQYDDVITAIREFLEQRVVAAKAAGVAQESIILDPGMGHFISSDAQYSLAVLARLSELAALGYPLYLSPSRKSFLAGSEKLPPADRLPGTVAASAIAVLHGASYIRTHDIIQVRRGCEIAAGIREQMR